MAILIKKTAKHLCNKFNFIFSKGIKRTVAILDNFEFFDKNETFSYKIKFLKDNAV